jgi:hypothetical protein
MPANEDANAADNAAGDAVNMAALGKLPYFRGNAKDTMAAHTWADGVDRARGLHKWTEEMACQGAMEAFREQANTWRENLSRGTPEQKAMLKNWTNLKKEFLKRFSLTRSSAQQIDIVSNLTQRNNERAKDFYDRVLNSLDNVNEDEHDACTSDDQKAGYLRCKNLHQRLLFVAGLLPETRKWVEAQMKPSEATLADLEQLANQWEGAAKSKNSNRQIAGYSLELAPEGASGGAANSEERIVAELAALKTQFARLAGGKKNNTGEKKKTTMPPMSARDKWRNCFRCKQWGLHIRDECKLSDSQVAQLQPQDKVTKPSGPAFDSQFPNC